MVEYLDQFRVGDNLILVMQYEPQNLLQFMQSRPAGRLPRDQSLRIIRQVLSALRHIHAHGVIFRDLKVRISPLPYDLTYDLTYPRTYPT